VLGGRYSGSADSKTAAQQQLAQLVSDSLRGGVADPSTETVGDYLGCWLEGREKARAVRTHQIQQGHLTRFIVPIIGARRLQKLAPADLRQVHQFLVSALGDAFRLELVARNMTEIVKPAPLRGKERKALPSFTAEETGLFLAAAHEDWRGAFFVLALSTGM